MQPQSGVVMTMAVLHRDIVADLPADAVATIIARRHASDVHLPAVLQEDAAGIVAVQLFVVRLVAIEGEVLDPEVLDILAAEEREERGRRRTARQPGILTQGPIQLEAVAVARHQRSLNDDVAAMAGIFGAQAYAIAHLKASRIGERDLLVIPIGVNRQCRFDRRLLDEHAIETAAEDAHVALQIDRVAKAIGTGQNAHSAAAPTSHRVDGCLDRLFIDAGYVGIFRPDGDGQPLFPDGLHQIAGGGPGIGDRRPVVACGQRRQGHRKQRSPLHWKFSLLQLYSAVYDHPFP